MTEDVREGRIDGTSRDRQGGTCRDGAAEDVLRTAMAVAVKSPSRVAVLPAGDLVMAKAGGGCIS